MVKQDKFKVVIKGDENTPDIERLFKTSQEVITFLELKSYNCLYNLMEGKTHINKNTFQHSSTKHLEGVKVERLSLKGSYPVGKTGKEVQERIVLEKSEFLNRIRNKGV